jgi:hypothetical protein
LEQIIQTADLIIHKSERFLTHSVFNRNQHDMDWSFFAIQDLKPIPKRVLHMNLETTRLRGIPRNRWQDEVREDGRTVGGERWQVRVTERNGRSSWERQGIITFCTCHWND